MESNRVCTSIHPSSNRVYNKLSNRDKVMIRCLLSTSIHESYNRMYNRISTRASRICYRVSTRVYNRLSNTASHMVYNGI